MTLEKGRLTDRIAIVTGAGSGIGQACAHLFAEHGARVLAVDLPGSQLAETVASAEGVEGAIVSFEKSVADDDAPNVILQTCLDTFGPPDILMNNAGVGANALAQDMTDEDWDRVVKFHPRIYGEPRYPTILFRG